MLFNLNFDVRFGILSSSSIFRSRTPFVTIFTIRFFASHAIIVPKMWTGAPFFENVNFDELIMISVKKCIR